MLEGIGHDNFITYQSLSLSFRLSDFKIRYDIKLDGRMTVPSNFTDLLLMLLLNVVKMQREDQRWA